MSKILWLDIETSGLDCRRNDVLQLAALVEIDGEIVEEKRFYFRPTNGSKVDKKALEVNGLKLKDVLNYPLAKDTLGKFKAMLTKYVDKFDKEDKFVLAGYYVQFDLNFLRETFKKQGDNYFGSWFFAPVIDVQTFVAICIARFNLRMKNYRLETVCERMGIKLRAHDAMSDIRATRRVYVGLGDLR